MKNGHTKLFTSVSTAIYIISTSALADCKSIIINWNRFNTELPIVMEKYNDFVKGDANKFDARTSQAKAIVETQKVIDAINSGIMTIDEASKLNCYNTASARDEFIKLKSQLERKRDLFEVEMHQIKSLIISNDGTAKESGASALDLSKADPFTVNLVAKAYVKLLKDQLPKILSSKLAIIDATQSDKSINFTYKVEIDTARMSQAELNDYRTNVLTASTIRNTCNEPGAKQLLNYGLSFQFSFIDMKKKPFHEISLSRMSCGRS
jgi:hypothetical protein